MAIVAPRAGAWIETNSLCCSENTKTSHPVRVRGLKRDGVDRSPAGRGRTPCGCVD